MRSLFCVALVTIALAGCAETRPDYAPRRASVIQPAIVPTTAWSMPDGSFVRTEIVGTDEIRPTDLTRPGYRALRMRMTLDNRGQDPWIVDPRQQIARVGGYALSFPSDASSQAIIVEPGQARTLDLFYPIPVPVYGPETPKHVWLDWHVRLPNGVMAHRAQFDRSTTYGWSARTAF